MKIILPEKNYSLDELNSTIYNAVKGYIENIKLLKPANREVTHHKKEGKITAPFPAYNQFAFSWVLNGDDLTMEVSMSSTQFIETLRVDFIIQVFLEVTKVEKSKKTSQLGYKFKAITKVYSVDDFVARTNRQGVYVSNFLRDRIWEYNDESQIYSYEDTQAQRSKAIIKNISYTPIYYYPKGHVKGIDVTESSSKHHIPRNTPVTIIPIVFNSPAFASFVKQMKRN